MGIVYNRENENVSDGDGPQSGTYGQVSFKRLCELLEASPHALGERITHLVFRHDAVRYRVEKR